MFNGRDNGGVIREAIGNRSAYVTLWADGGKALASVLALTAPADNIRIDEGVDYTLSKSLAGDFMVATFGHKPVTITISGFDIYNDPCLEQRGALTVQAFYDKWNVHNNKEARINVGMAGSTGAGTAYRCVLVALQRHTAQELTVDGVGKYTMMLFGALMTK